MYKEDSLKKRYFAKLGTNLIGFVLNMCIATIVPRGLGPKAYGDFSFLSVFFSRIISFLDMGTSTCFYTKLSQRQQDFGLVSFYIWFSFIISFVLIIFVVCINKSGLYSVLLSNQTPFYIYLAMAWGIFTWITKVLSKMADAYGVTVSAEFGKILQRILGVFILIILFFSNQLNLTHFFFYHYFINIFLIFSFLWVMKKAGYSLYRSWMLSFIQVRGYIIEFFKYSHPLFVMALFGLITGILDRWLLQSFAGSVQQGFFGLSYKISTICFLFTSAITPLITREFSIAYAENNVRDMARSFRRFVPMLYSIAAYFACFIALEANKVTVLIGGNEFNQAVIPVTIMAFYPIHQTYGQLSGSVFHATGHTSLYRNIRVLFSMLGLPLIYFLVAPVEKMGFNFGATGLAIKTVALQFFAVNTLLWYNSRFLGLRFWRYLSHQILSVLSFLLMAFVAMQCIEKGFGIKDKIFISFLLEGLLYSFLVLIVCYIQPALFGLKKNDISLLIDNILMIFKK